MRFAMLALTLFAFACATTAPAPPPAAAATPPPCNPGMALLNATVWVQSGAEYRANAIQTYATARRMLDAALADPAWHTEDGTSDPSQPPAVILDADETVIDNTAYEARVIKLGKTFDDDTWKQWGEEAAAEAVPGAAEFLAYAKSRGVTPFFITNRDFDEEPGTRRNLEKLGYPVSTDPDNILTRGEKPEWKSDKTSRRAHVAASYRVLLLFGDDLNDFANARDKSAAERDAIIDRTLALWGTRWFMLANPIYGSWERSITGGTGTPCEQLQKKIDALQE